MDRTIILGVKRIIKTIRYRFFIFAGVFPYLLGQIIAWNANKTINWHYSWWGFLGIIFVLIGVELFNEYFDAKDGSDRIFLSEKHNVPNYFFILGLFMFLFAFFIGLYFTLQIGWPILLFSFLGFLGAYFYVGPPVRWAYRGLGELVIALSYGPVMVLGSYYLQAKRIDILPSFASLILGLLVFSLAIVNEIPDYFQDRLVGKKNIVVRLGRHRAVKLFRLCLICIFILLGMGIGLKMMPFSAGLAFLALPFSLRGMKIASKHYDAPMSFLPAIRATILTHITIVSSLTLSYLKN